MRVNRLMLGFAMDEAIVPAPKWMIWRFTS